MPDASRRQLMIAAWNGLKSATWLMRIRVVQKIGAAAPTPAQMSVLQTLLSGEEGMTPRELSGCLHVTPATITGNLNALEDNGLIERVRKHDDRRVVHIQLTPTGREKVRKWRAIFEGELQEHFAPLNEDELRQVASLLAKLSPPSQKNRARRKI